MELGVITALFVFVTVFFLILGLAPSSATGTAARQRLEAFKRGGPQDQAEAPPPSATFGERVLQPLLHGATAALGRLLPRSMLSGVEKQLLVAGEPMTMSGFLTMVLVATGASTLLGVLLVFVSGAAIGPMQIGIVGVVGLIGFILPFYIVRSRAKQRQTAIIRSLPDAFDLITTCVEAGLGLDAALARVAEKVPGPFAQELTRALRDVALGKARRDALKELGERTGVPDLIQFTNAVIQAEAMGSSVGTVLRVQAEQLRVRRRQRAEEQAYKAPVKMLFPLVLCIFPTLFIVILGPAIITIMNGFPGK
ncbi:MAG TPA: type II secretion system F family protein [Dehalococcoidia bacterium]|nr:type II secretion system F family protein [Dehalococcoidia bacterium]